MKKKWTALLLAGTVLLNLTACQGNDSGKKTVQETEEISQGVKDAWSDLMSAQPVVNGAQASYGPIVMTLPEGYVIGSKDLSDSSFYATDALQSNYNPHITFSNQSVLTSYSPGMKEELEKQMKEALSKEGAEFKEVLEYEESELEGYGVIRATVQYTYEGLDLVDEIYQLYETTNEYGGCVTVEYYGKKDDEQHLAKAKEAMDSIALITGNYETMRNVNIVTGWESEFNSMSGALAVEGNSVKFGPLHIDLPEGYAVEDETAEQPMFYAPDGGDSYSFSYGSDSYYLMCNKDYVNSTFLQEYMKSGYENINLTELEPVEVSGRKAVRMSLNCVNQGMQILQIFYVIFEDIDAVMTPCITVLYSNYGGQGESAETVASVFNSMRID